MVPASCTGSLRDRGLTLLHLHAVLESAHHPLEDGVSNVLLSINTNGESLIPCPLLVGTNKGDPDLPPNPYQ